MLSSICDVGSERAATGDHSCLKQRGTRVQLAPSTEDSGMHLEHAASRGGLPALHQSWRYGEDQTGVGSPCPNHTPAAKIVSLWTRSALSLGALVKRQLLKEKIGQKSRCSRILTLLAAPVKQRVVTHSWADLQASPLLSPLPTHPHHPLPWTMPCHVKSLCF